LLATHIHIGQLPASHLEPRLTDPIYGGMTNKRKNLFVFGLDDFHRADLEALPRAEEFEFHDLLTFDEATRGDLHGTPEMLEKAEQRLRDFDGSVDGIMTHWDFPSTVMTPILRHRFSQPGPTVEAALKCEHKYWSRLEQHKAVPEAVPDFAPVNPFADDPLEHVHFDYPFWLKPVTAHSSNLGFRIDGPEDLEHALEQIREGIALFAEPLNYLSGFASLPPEIEQVDGYHCVAETIISKGRQCTLEGFRYQGETEVYGVIDTVRDPRFQSCLSRYQYPSSIPQKTQERMIDVTRRVLDQFGYDHAPFNVEFFWDEDSDELKLLEVNSRISQSHSPLFALVDGASHQQVVIDLALGQRPEPPRRQGHYKLAAKFMMRVFESGTVARAPSEGDLVLLTRQFPEVRFEPHVKSGDSLTDLPFQDSYSFNVADIYLGADSQPELLEKYETCKQMMPFEILRRPEIV